MVMNSFTDRTIRLHLVPLVGLLSLCLAWSCSVFADEVEDAAEEATYSRGANQCMVCHREGRDNAAHEIFFGQMGISDSQDSPFADGRHDCETCHGPSDSHRRRQPDGSRLSPAITFNEKTPVAKQNQVCMACHDNAGRMHWVGSMHEEEEVACSDCHEVHVARDPAFDKLAQQEKCFACHQRQRSDTFKNSSHPLRFGDMTCSDCHDPHDGVNDFMLVESNVNDTCYTCHAEKRGPYLWEHAPVSEDCGLCHNAHGSNHAALLTQRSPLLCQQCHSSSGHPSLAYTSESADDVFQQRFLLGRSCSNCHTQVHGSNHPSGVQLTR
jgi:DmsE family decaheme c-type cytochrome